MSTPGHAAQGPHPPSGQPDDPTAVTPRRTLAWVIDGLILLALIVAFSAVGPFGSYEDEASLTSAGFTLDNGCEAIEDATGASQCLSAPDTIPFLESDRIYYLESEYQLLGLAAMLAYLVLVYGILQGVTGATPGKFVARVRVVNEIGGSPGVGRSLLRSVMWVVDGAPWVIPGVVAFVISLTTVGHRRIGDMAARTFVVRAAAAHPPLLVPGYAPDLPISAYQGPPVPRPAATAAPTPITSEPEAAPTPTAEPVANSDEHSDTEPTPSAEMTPRAEPLAGTEPTSSTEPTPGTEPLATPEASAAEEAPPGPEAAAVEASPEEPAAEEIRPEEPSSAEVNEPAPTVGPEADPAAPDYQPRWDPARGTYLVWDEDRGRWLQWDTEQERWFAI